MEQQHIRVLLVEDDPDDVLLLREGLHEVTSVQFDFEHVGRLGEAMQRIGGVPLDVILLDLSLPDSQGLETFREVHRRARDIPVVVLTGLDDETVAVRAVQEGAQDYLIKGQVHGGLLARSIRYAIERQRTSHYRALLMERERFDTALSQMTDGIVVTDGDWRVTSANHAACLLLNLPEDGWEGTQLDDALAPFTLSEPLAALRASRARSQALDVSRPHTKPPLFLDGRLTRLFDSTGGLVSAVLTLRDATEERQDQALRASFFMMVSHKLRTPLSVLTACIDLCKRRPPEPMASRLPEILGACDREVKRLRDAVQRLLDLKALSAQELQAEGQPTNIVALANSTGEKVRARYPARQIRMTIEVRPDATYAACDAEHLELVLAQLLDNAAKFADKQPVRIVVRADRAEPSWVRFSVSDNGPGIPHEYYDRIFDGFVQVEDRPTGQVPGMGVGLYMARQVVEAYGGAISVHSQIGEGSTLTFTVPASQPD